MRCKTCGKKFVPLKAEVKRGNGKFCSRSCSAREWNRIRPRRGRKKLTYAEKKKKYGADGWWSVMHLVGRAQWRAKKAGFACELTTKVFKEMWERQKGKCFYTKRAMKIGRDGSVATHLDCASVDRVDNSRGYTKDNMVLCCYWVNSAKSSGSVEDLRVRAKELVAGLA